MANPIRTRVADRLARMIDYRVRQQLRPAVARLRQRMDNQRDRLDRQHKVLTKHRDRLDTIGRRLDAMDKAIKGLRRDLGWTTNEVKRIIPHLAAQEDRIETLRASLALTPRAEEGDVAEARSLIEEVQRQHAQIRARMSTIALYEERLRRLEDAIPERVPE